MTNFKSFRTSLRPVGSELHFCSPDCQENHDAKWKGGQPSSAATPEPTTPGKEEPMATISTTGLASGIGEVATSAANERIVVDGKTVARVYTRKSGALVLYFDAEAVEGIKVAADLGAELAKDGTLRVKLTGTKRQFDAARALLKRVAKA